MKEKAWNALQVVKDGYVLIYAGTDKAKMLRRVEKSLRDGKEVYTFRASRVTLLNPSNLVSSLPASSV